MASPGTISRYEAQLRALARRRLYIHPGYAAASVADHYARVAMTALTLKHVEDGPESPESIRLREYLLQVIRRDYISVFGVEPNWGPTPLQKGEEVR